MSVTEYRKIVLPVPPSSNRYWRHNRGVIHVSTEGLRYRADVGKLCSGARMKPFEGDVVLRLTWYRKAKQGDLDNRLKQCLDAMQGYMYSNDSQIAEIRLRRHEDKLKPRLVVECAADGTNMAAWLMNEYRDST